MVYGTGSQVDADTFFLLWSILRFTSILFFVLPAQAAPQHSLPVSDRFTMDLPAVGLHLPDELFGGISIKRNLFSVLKNFLICWQCLPA